VVKIAALDTQYVQMIIDRLEMTSVAAKKPEHIDLFLAIARVLSSHLDNDDFGK
jgi:hypothetical protein